MKSLLLFLTSVFIVLSIVLSVTACTSLESFIANNSSPNASDTENNQDGSNIKDENTSTNTDENIDDNTQNNNPDDSNGESGGSQGGEPGGSQGGEPGGSQDGEPGGSQGGEPGDSQGGESGGSQGGEPGGTQGGEPGGTQGGESGGSQGGNQENNGDNNTDTTDTVQESLLPHYSYADTKYGVYNTELFYVNSYDIALGDPTVLPVTENGVTWFYVTGTTSEGIFELYKTRNFSEWKYIGSIFSPEESFFGKSSFWAPQLMYDPDADRSYYLGDPEETGKGLYILFFSARDANNVCALSVAFSKNVEGPYVNFKGINANGDHIDESNSCFEMSKLKGLGLYADHIYGDLYKANRSFIDASPFIDPVTGDKYLYMVRSRNVDSSNDVWGVKMKDWVSPDYATTTPLTSYGYTDINKTEVYSYKAKNNIDEGPFLYYKDATDDGVSNGKYYLTFSIGDTSDKLYPVCQAIGSSPLGPFTKIQPENSGVINSPEELWDIHGSGHHAFFEVNGELYIAYHTYKIASGASIAKRYFAFNRVEWILADNGEYLMRSNGPSKAIEPLPSAASGYTNVALGVAVSIEGKEQASVLCDGIIATKSGDEDRLFSFSEDTVITLTLDEYVRARAILIYNSYDYASAFSVIDKIELSYRKKINGIYYTGIAVIESLGFNFDANLVSESYLTAKGASNLLMLRPAGAAIAEFDEIEISSVKIHVSAGNNRTTAISEIVILGSACDEENITYGGNIKNDSFPPYTAFTDKINVPEEVPNGTAVTIDGKLDEPLWSELAAVTVIEGIAIDNETKEPVDIDLYGERQAKVYSYIGNKYIYFAFEVKDKNLFFNPSQPQGRSTAVELYFCAADVNSLTEGCYSVRINPTSNADELFCNIGVYVPNSSGTEWRSIGVMPTVFAAAVVRGTVISSDTEYDSSENEGYTIEIAIDKSLIGLDAVSMRFTAAFVQDRGYNDPRIGNSFIKNTHYTKPYTWIIFRNEE